MPLGDVGAGTAPITTPRLQELAQQIQTPPVLPAAPADPLDPLGREVQEDPAIPAQP